MIKNNQKLKELNLKLKLISHDLKTIKKSCNLEQVILHCGAVLAILLGHKIADWDIFYKPKDSEKNWRYYHGKIQTLDLKLIKRPIDTYNSIDIIPWLTPLELTVGVYSDHTEYFSMFAINENGEIITNTIAWLALIRAVHYPRKYKLNYAPETIHYFKVTLPFIRALYDKNIKFRELWNQKTQSKGFKNFQEVIQTLQSFV